MQNYGNLLKLPNISHHFLHNIFHLDYYIKNDVRKYATLKNYLYFCILKFNIIKT